MIQVLDVDNMTDRQEQVHEFLMDKVDRWLQDAKENDESDRLITMIRGTRQCILAGASLDKQKAKWLETILSDHLNREIANHAMYKQHMNPMMEVDSWQIYTEAYVMFARPGAHTI